MHRVGYSLVSHYKPNVLYQGFYSIEPDDGNCTMCLEPRPVLHISKDQDYLFSICESCTKQMVLAFSWGNEA